MNLSVSEVIAIVKKFLTEDAGLESIKIVSALAIVSAVAIEGKLNGR